MLKGKTALITGAAKRIGKACALSLAGEGVNIIVHYYKSKKEAENTADLIRTKQVSAWTLRSDLSNPANGEKIIANALKLSGNIDFLINSASIFPESKISDVKMSDFTKNININALSPFFLSKSFVAKCKAGVIVNFLDARITDYDQNHVAYHLSKRMLFSLTRMMSIEFAPDIRVNGIAPGIIIPPEGTGQSDYSGLSHTNPLNRTGSIKEVTDSLLFLIKNRFITGEILFIDGLL